MKNDTARGEGASQPQEIKKPQIRSPNFPAISLRDAIEKRAQSIFDEWKSAQIPVAAAYTKWGYRASGSALGGQSLAAVKAFGLVDVEGTGANQKIRLSDRAQKILRNHPDRDRLIREAALSPAIYDEVWAKFGPDTPDVTISHYLEWEREVKFRPEAIEIFLKNFRDTIAFAKLAPVDTMEGGGNDDQGASPGPLSVVVADGLSIKDSPPRGAVLPKGGADMITDTLTLDGGIVAFQYPKGLSQEEYDDLDAWMKIQLRKVKRLIKTDGGNVPTAQD